MKIRLISFFALMLVFAACGTSGSDTPTTTEVAPATTEVAPATTEVAPTTTEVAPTTITTTEPSGSSYYELASGSSVVFYIYEGDTEEDLVIGSTTSVTGGVTFDYTDVSTATGGSVSVNAGSFDTGDVFRNEALRLLILDASSFPEITFAMTGVSQIDQSDILTLNGDLTVRHITIPVTFAMTVSERGDGRVVMSGSAAVTRSSLDLGPPGVSDNVTLKATLVFES